MNRARVRRALIRTAAAVSLLAVSGIVPVGAAVSAAGPTADPEQVASSAAVPAVVPDPDQAIITLTRVTPTVLDGRGQTQITGTITAPTSGPIARARIVVVLGSRPLTVRGDLDTWVKDTGRAAGRVVAETTTTAVPAGATAPFSVSLNEREVSTRDAFAALPISVEAYERGVATPIGVTRTFLAWNSRVEFAPLELAIALPVTLDPRSDLFVGSEQVRRQAWTDTIGPGSRIDRIVQGTAGSPVTLAVDPSVLVAGPDELGDHPGDGGAAGTSSTPGPTATSPSTPPSPSASTPPVTPTPGDGETSGGAPLVDRLATDLSGRDLWALPYADADLAATSDADPANSLVRTLVSRASSLGSRLGEPVRGDIAWPADGLLPSGRERSVQSLYSDSVTRKAAGIVVNQSAISAASPYTPTARRRAAGGTHLLAYDQPLSQALPTRRDVTPVLKTQRFVAETLVLLGERPGTPRSVFVTAPRSYDPDPSTLSAFLTTIRDLPWLQQVSAESLLSDSKSDRAVPQAAPARAAASAAPVATLTRPRLGELAGQRHTVDAVATVLANGVAFGRAYGEVLDELTSVRWRYRPEAWTTLNEAVSAEVRSATSAIKVVPRRINFLAENGSIRITVENGLGYAVENLRLVVTPQNPRLQVLAQPGPVSIAPGPGARQNVSVPVRAVAAGRVDILAYLTTADGTRIGSEARIPVSANPLDSTFYWIGGVLAGLVLVAGVLRTVLKGTSRIDEIGDLDTVAEHDEAAQDGQRG